MSKIWDRKNIENYNFFLPKNLIASYPLSERSQAKLLYVDRKRKISDCNFLDIVDLLRAGDLLIFNDTKVIQASLIGMTECGVNVKVNLLKNLGEYRWEIIAKPGKKIKPGTLLLFRKRGKELNAKVISKDGMIILVDFDLPYEKMLRILEVVGDMPIPPYLGRETEELDREKYQTVYANRAGSVAAPTAGLHFTEDLMTSLKKKGVELLSLTLNIGGGTFFPIKVENIDEHKMHSESYEIRREVVEAIYNAKQEGRRIFCVGTTSLRVLEDMADEILYFKDRGAVDFGKDCFSGVTDIFIKPGYRFRVVDGLVTNFHLPKSTLFVLICSILGVNSAHRVYDHAIKNHYRFFSYGDACLFEFC